MTVSTNRPAPLNQTPQRAVASFPSYGDAERAVDWLSDQGFPVERVTIVGHDLRFEERVLGRMTIGRAALMGAGQGALIGVIFAALLGVFFTSTPAFLGLLLYGVVAGAVLGAAFGALLHAATGGRRDFTGAPAIRAAQYEVMVDEPMAGEADRLLARLPARTAPA
jgi:hypothetical protein